MDKLGITLEEIGTTEQYFKNKLGEDSEGFLMLKKLVEENTSVKEVKGRITWSRLKRYTKIKRGEVEGINWELDLDLRGTGMVSLWKIKKVYRHLDLSGTNIISLGKLKEVKGNLYLENMSILEDIGALEKVGGYLGLRGTSVELQLEIMRKIRNGELKVEGGVYYDEVAIKEYFKKEILKTTEDFLLMERLVKETNGKIRWQELQKYTNITSLGEKREISGNLILYNISNLKDIGDLEEVGGNLDVRGTSIELQLEVMRKIKNRELIVMRDIYFGGNIEGIEQLLEKKKILGKLDIRLLNIELQLEVMRKIEDRELIVKGDIYFGGNIKGIEQLLEQQKISSYLDLRGTNVELQLEVMMKVKNNELIITGTVFYDAYIKQYLTEEGKLNFEKFEEKYGTKVDKIEGEQQDQIREFLEYMKKIEIEYLEKEIVKILKEDITQEEMKEKVAKLYIEYKVYIQKIDEYLDNKN